MSLMRSRMRALKRSRMLSIVYFGVAATWYLACVGSLVHSFRTVADLTERNQVKWIMFGAVGALVPISYSLYLALLHPDAFAAGATTWPMFAASACLTGAFAVSITRYRLMELDKIISSSVGYFLISFLAGLVFYAVVFVGTLIFNQVFHGPELDRGLDVSTTALVLMLILDQARSRFKKVLDRRFSRDKSQLDRTLQQMSQAVQQLVDPPALAQRLLQATTELMGVTRGSVFLRQGDPPLYRLQGSLGPTPSLDELSSGCPLIEALKEGNIVSLRQRSTPGQTPAQRQLQLLGGEIAHPLAHEGRLLALLVLGPKDSPYRADDFNLLAAFAQITVLALESADGHRTIEGLNRELQAKVEKISEQQRRILALQSQLQPADQARRADEQGRRRPARPTPSRRPPPPASGIVGSSPVLQQLLTLVRKVATTAGGRAHSRRKRHRQGAAGPGRARKQPQGRQAVRQGPLCRPVRQPARNRSCSATSRVRSPAPTATRSAASNWPTAAPCSSTKSATSASTCRPSCCASCRKRSWSGSAPASRCRSTSASSRPRIRTWKT